MELWTNVRARRTLRQPLLAYFVCLLWCDQWRNAVDAKVVRRDKVFESGLSTDPRIVGGTPAAPGDYPFYVNTIQPILCGATLIYEDIVLTAAHCAGGFLAGVNIGATMLDGTDAAEVIAVDMEVIHPDYNQDTRINDIMLVKLSTPASSPVVTLNTDPNVPATDEVVTVIGFGDTADGGDPSDVLRMVDVNVYSDQFCDDLYQVFEPDTMLCAGTAAGGRDSCQGDSGGPLLTSTNVQIGIVSTGSGCGLPDVPAVYTQVSAFQSFIRQGICDLSSNPPSDCGPTSAPVPGGVPVATPTEAPVAGPATSSPTVTPVAGPTTSSPTVTPVAGPTTSSPTVTPVAGPTTSSPTVTPVAGPTTSSPTVTPVAGPTTASPTVAPVASDPTDAPAASTGAPTVTFQPTTTTAVPTPATEPTAAPIPAMEPTAAPFSPTSPTDEPTIFLDTLEPTLETHPPYFDGNMGDGKGRGMMMGGKGGMMMGGKGGMMMGKKSHKGMMMSQKGYPGKGGKGSFGKGLKITSKGNYIMALHIVDDSNDDNGLDSVIDLISGSP